MTIIKLKKYLLASTLAILSSTVFADGLYGTGDNFGGGWQSDGMGGYYGTGDNLGRGWQSDGMGGYYGTGDNFGQGYQQY